MDRTLNYDILLFYPGSSPNARSASTLLDVLVTCLDHMPKGNEYSICIQLYATHVCWLHLHLGNTYNVRLILIYLYVLC